VKGHTTLDEIDAERDQMFEELVMSRIKLKWWEWAVASRDKAISKLTKADIKPIEQHRGYDEEICVEIHDLAKAVALEGAGLQIHIIAADFAVIKNHYKP
jgi:hypothetical protein